MSQTSPSDQHFGAADDDLLLSDTSRENHHDWLRLHYDECLLHALDLLHKKKGCYGSLIAPSSYLFSTNGYTWAMDIAFQHLYGLAEMPSRVREYLGGIDCMLLTHEHSDHAEKRTICALADTDIDWVVPSFLLDRVLSFGVRRDKITVVNAGDNVNVGPLRICVLEGRHFRPETGVGVDSVGYLITADDAPTLAFPGDIRDYSVAGREELNADCCFAHVWLTDNALDPAQYIPKSRELAEFMLRASRKSILLAHLNADRVEGKRWTVRHALVVSEAIKALSPETTVSIPRYGEIFDLSNSD